MASPEPGVAATPAKDALPQPEGALFERPPSLQPAPLLEMKDDFEELENETDDADEEEPNILDSGAYELLEQLYQSNSYTLEPLIQALYDLPDYAIEAILPQLCHLFQIWPEWKSQELGPWFVYKCCKSVHLALKIIWWVSASAHYTTPERKTKCLKLVDDCEMSLVNAEIINDGLGPRLTRKRLNSRSRLRRFLPTASPPSLPPQAQPETGLQPSAGPETPDQPPAAATAAATDPVVGSPAPSATPGAPADDSTVEPPLTPASQLELENAIRAKVSAGLGFLQLAQEEQRVLLSGMRQKRLRVEYFNAHLSLIAELDRASEILAKVPRKNGQRQARLAAFVDSLNASHIKGLYFPGLKASDRHYRVIRILEARCLSSRDKAPFVMNIEVVGTGRRCGHPEIYGDYGLEIQELLPPAPPPQAGLCRPGIPERPEQDEDSGDEPSAVSGASDAAAGSQESSPESTRAGSVADFSRREVSKLQDRVALGLSSAASSPRSQAAADAAVESADEGDGAEQQPVPSSAPRHQDEDEEDGAAEGPVRNCFSLERIPRLASLPSHSQQRRVSNSAAASGGSAPGSPHGGGADSGGPLPTRYNTMRLPPRAGGHGRHQDAPVNKDYTHNVGDKLAQQEISQIFGHPWNATVHNFALVSPHSMLPGWNMISVIYKAGDDCRQEALAMQLINIFHEVWTQAKLPLKLHPYFTLVTSHRSGVIETVADTMSVDGIKRKLGGKLTLRQFVEKAFGRTGEMLDRAQRNFTESMAAYSVVSYLLQIKDRHNGNILMDSEGHLIHVDHGFMLSNTPGNVAFETAPFKLSREYLEVMDGEASPLFSYFKLLFVKGFLEIRKHAQRLLLLVEIMSHDSQMPCYQGMASPSDVVDAFRERFVLHLPLDDCMRHVMGLVDQSLNSWRTSQYDTYQRFTNGIL